jgi:hypothetical protein
VICRYCQRQVAQLSTASDAIPPAAMSEPTMATAHTPPPVPQAVLTPVEHGVAAATPVSPTVERSNGSGTAGGILGIVGFLASWTPILGIFIGLVFGVLAIIFGAVGLAKTNAPRGMATTGLVLGILTVIFKLIPGFNLL